MKNIKPNQKRWFIVIAVTFGVYILSLFTPYISNVTRYPVYFVKCGFRSPIAGITFAAAYSYTLPGEPNYEKFGDEYFCTEAEAEAAEFHNN